jgi:hypothetical protein
LPVAADNNTVVCQDPVLALGAQSGPQGSFGGYFTHLAGVNLDRPWPRFHMDQQYVGSAVDDLIAKRTASHV